MIAARFARSPIVRVVGSLWIGFLTAQVLGFLATVWTVRALGPAVFGAVAAAQALAAYATLFASAGTDVWGTREAARYQQGSAPPVGLADIMGARTIAALTASAFIILLASLQTTLRQDLRLIALFCLASVPVALRFDWWLLARSRGWVVGLANGARAIVTLAIVAVAVHAPVDKEWVAIAQIAGLAVASLVSLRFATDAFEWRASPSFANLKRITKEALPLGAALLAAQIYYNLDVILLRLWRSEAETGLYASAYRIALLIIGLRHLLVQGLFPQLVRSAHAGAEEARTIVLAAQRVGTSFGFPLVVGGILWATPVLRLVFGEGFRGAGSTFAVLLAMTGVVFIDLAWPQLLNAYDRSGTYFWVILSGAIVNLALNIVLIPRVGMMGAAIATFAAELAVMLAAVWSVRSTVRVPFFSYASRPLMASIGMAVAGYVTMPAGLIWSIGSAVAVYLLLLVVSRAVTFNDFIVLERGTA